LPQTFIIAVSKNVAHSPLFHFFFIFVVFCLFAVTHTVKE